MLGLHVIPISDYFNNSLRWTSAVRPLSI